MLSWIWVRWYTMKKLWGSANTWCLHTHTAPLAAETRPDRTLTRRKRGTLQIWEGGRKKKSWIRRVNMQPFKPKYWQKVGRKISQEYKEHLERKVNHWGHQNASSQIQKLCTETTKTNAWCEGRFPEAWWELLNGGKKEVIKIIIIIMM